MHAADQDPTRQNALRKLRAFLGLLMNAEEALLTNGFDLTEAYRFALGEHDRLEELEQAALDRDSSSLEAWHRQERLVERRLFQRWNNTVAFLQAHAPDHRFLPHYLSYLARWRQAGPGHTPQRPDPPSPATGDPEIFGLAFDRLLQLHARLSSMSMPHEYVRSYVVFLAGLAYAARRQSASGRPPTHPLRDELHAVSNTCLETAVDFAMQAGPQSLARTSAHLPADIAFHCLFMGIAFVEQNCASTVADWLARGSGQENLLRLFFAMGVLALTSSSARRLVRQVQPDLPRLVSNHIGNELGQLLERFALASA